MIWNPPLLDAELGLRASPLGDASRLLAAHVRGDSARSASRRAVRRRSYPSLRSRARRHRDRAPPGAVPGGLHAEQRREIERRLVEGELLGVTATDALELGIDIGLLDCAISVGFPGTVASLRQQWDEPVAESAVWRSSSRATTRSISSSRVSRKRSSRAGSRRRSSITRTREFSTRTCSPQPSRPRSRTDDAAIARIRGARRGPSSRARAHACRLRLEGPRLSGRAHLVAVGRRGGVHGRGRRNRIPARPRRARSRLLNRARGRGLPPPRRAVSRGVASLEERVAVVEPARRRLVHAGEEGVGDDDRVEREVLEHARRRAPFRPRLGDRAGRRLRAQGGPRRLHARRRPHARCRESTFETEAIWICPEPEQLAASGRCRSSSARCTRPSTAVIALFPLWAMCDRWDIGGLSTNVHYQAGRPSIFVYDGHAGGVGITERGFDAIRGLGRGHRAHAPALSV